MLPPPAHVIGLRQVDGMAPMVSNWSAAECVAGDTFRAKDDVAD